MLSCLCAACAADYCIGRWSPPAPADLDHLVDIAIRNEPRERERDELERHVDTFSDELELVEPTSLTGRFVQSLKKGGALHPQSKHAMSRWPSALR